MHTPDVLGLVQQMASECLFYIMYLTKYTPLRTRVFHTVNTFSQFLNAVWSGRPKTWSLCDNSYWTSRAEPSSPLCRFKSPSSSHHSPSKSFSILITPFAIKIILRVPISSNFIESIDLTEHSRKMFSAPCSRLRHALENRASKNEESKFLDKLHTIRRGNNHCFR